MTPSTTEQECLTPTNRAAEEAINSFEEKTGIHVIDGPVTHPGEPADIWYFAYGSNMCDEVFRVRRMVNAAETVPARLPGYRLAFTLPALPFREPAMASVEPVPAEELAAAAQGDDARAGIESEEPETENGDVSKGDESTPDGGVSKGDVSMADTSADGAKPTLNGSVEAHDSKGEGGADADTDPVAKSSALPKSHSRTFMCKTSNSVCVHGVAHRVTAAQWSYICETEGGAGCDNADYVIVSVEIEAYDGRRLKAFTLITSPRTLQFNNGRRILPSKRYAGLLRRGAAENGLNAAYQEYLNTMPVYVPRAPGQRVGAVLFSLLSTMLIAFFVLMRIRRKLFGYRPNLSRGRRPLMAVVFHVVARLSWRAHDVLQPILGSGAE